MKNKLRNIYQSVVLLILLAAPFALDATHVVGGNIQYKCLGGNQYEITVEFAVDCGIGDSEALELDMEATVRFFDAGTNMPAEVETNGEVSIPFQDVIQLGDPNIACRVLSSPVCVQRQRYVQVVTLPFNPNGYIISYRRCCRNNTLLNIVDPLDTGGTYWIELTPEAQMQCNTAARFRNWADVYVCSNEDIVFDASAFDEDGDSLVYRLCNPTVGGSDAQPLSTNIYFPPFQEVVYATGYDLTNLMGAGIPPALDPATGILTLNAQQEGQFLLGLCVEEFRDGVKISETRRDFQYNVRACTDPPLAAFEAQPNPSCDDLTTQFTNGSLSTQGNPLSYEWYFDFPNLTPFSSDQDPNFTYGAPGLYTVALVTFDGSCQDTSFQEVGVSVIGDPEVNFDLSSSGCDGGDIDVFLNDLTTTAQDIVDYQWTVQSNTGTDIYSGPNPNFMVNGAQTLTVTLDIITISGCAGNITLDFPVNGDGGPMIDPGISGGSMDACANAAFQLNQNGNGLYTYSWSSSDPNVAFATMDVSPVVVITQPTVFTVTVTDQAGCTAIGSVEVIPAPGPTLDAQINGASFTSCVGVPFQLNPNGDAQYNYSWSSSDPSVSIASTDVSPVVIATQNTTFSVTVSDQFGCTSVGSVNVTPGSGPSLNLANTMVQCIGDTISINPQGPTNLMYNWSTDPPGALSDSSDPNPIVVLTETTSFTVTVSDMINPDCSSEFTTVVTVPEIINIEIESDNGLILCDGLSTNLTVITDGNSFTWVGPSGEDLGNQASIPVAFGEDGTYTVVVTDAVGCTDTEEVTITTSAAEEIDISSSTSNQFYCVGDSVTLTGSLASVDFDGAEWTDANGNVIGSGEEISILPSDTVSYSVMALTDLGCPVEGIFTLIPSQIEATIDGPIEVCLGEEIEYNSLVSVGDAISYEWMPSTIVVGNNDQSNVIISPTSDMDLTLQVTNSEGCTFTASQPITILSVGLITIVADPESLAFGQSSQLSVTPNLPGYSYSWSPAEDFDDPFSPTPIVTPSSIGDIEYTVEVTSPDGCVDFRTITILVEETPCSVDNIHVPNMFTPNGDSHNDVFTVYTNVQDEKRLIVFDRWGEIVFDSELEGSFTWDGTYEGVALNPDVYGYCVEVSCEGGEKFTKTGNITLVK